MASRHVRHGLSALALGVVLCTLCAPAGATIMKYMTVEELARVSSEVVRGTVLGQTAHWTDDHQGILTIIDVAVHERLKGGRPINSVVQIVHSGGELGGTRMLVIGSPTYADGEEVFLFLAPYSDDPAENSHAVVIGGKMGKLPVVRDPDGGEPLVLRELNDLEFAEFIEDRGKAHMRLTPAPAERRIPISEFRRRVLSADRPSGVGPPQGRP